MLNEKEFKDFVRKTYTYQQSVNENWVRCFYETGIEEEVSPEGAKYGNWFDEEVDAMINEVKD